MRSHAMRAKNDESNVSNQIAGNQYLFKLIIIIHKWLNYHDAGRLLFYIYLSLY